jgi:hypothetical protein
VNSTRPRILRCGIINCCLIAAFGRIPHQRMLEGAPLNARRWPFANGKFGTSISGEILKYTVLVADEEQKNQMTRC